MLNYKTRIYGKTKNISIEELIQKFNKKEFEYIKLIALFGSRANDLEHFQSDYDFAILVDKDIETPWGYMAKVWYDIGNILELDDCDVDVVDLSNANRLILNSIKKKYILLKGDDNELQRIFDKYN